MDSKEMKGRTKDFAVRVINMVDQLPKSRAASVISNQILRSATSIGANYREACRARSHKEFISKLAVAEGEADETLYWLELTVEAGMMKKELLADLLKEANEILAILIASGRTAKSR